MAGLLDPMLIVYLLAFYMVTFLVFGSLMMIIGSAVNQMADAQSLLGPIMILLVGGYAMTPIVGAAAELDFQRGDEFHVLSSIPSPCWRALLPVRRHPPGRYWRPC